MSYEYELKDLSLQQLVDIDTNLYLLELHYNISISLRGTCLYFSCEKNDEIYKKCCLIIDSMIDILKKGNVIDDRIVTQIITLCDSGDLDKLNDLYKIVVGVTFDHKKISPKTLGQLHYVNALKNYDIVICSGPAGSGKTYLAVVHAVNELKNNRIKKIILTRPAVEAGESLGFLPGDLKEKVDPYLRPLYDALDECLGKENTLKLIEKGVIEIAPLAYMRGRTLEDAIIILDEGQNTTISQMKMFLTRLGFHSKMIITGDVTQIDLSNNRKSGLISALEILKDIKSIKCCFLTSKDVSRHPLVKAIVDAYEKHGY